MRSARFADAEFRVGPENAKREFYRLVFRPPPASQAGCRLSPAVWSWLLRRLTKRGPPFAAVPPSLGRRLEDSAIRRVVVYRKSHTLCQTVALPRRSFGMRAPSASLS